MGSVVVLPKGVRGGLNWQELSGDEESYDYGKSLVHIYRDCSALPLPGRLHRRREFCDWTI